MTDMLVIDETLKVNVFSVSNKSTTGLICSGSTSIIDVIQYERGLEQITLESPIELRRR